MPGKLLIVNSYHPNARYVPMGSFGICDHLTRQGHEARIFNCPLYATDEYLPRLEQEILEFRPLIVGLVMQWKEYTVNAIRLARRLKRGFPEIPLIAGGMTAGYFAEPLLSRYPAFDGVIRGDPEEPLRRLLDGEDWSTVPNLLFRDGVDLLYGEGRWQAESGTLKEISFAGIEHMVDGERYLRAVEPLLGFPVFIGRGCVYDCPYCGGSSKAFVEHSGRQRPVGRSIAAVLEDLRRISRHTRTVYIGYENSTGLIKKLFRLVASDPELTGLLTLNYGSWGLPDRELLELYAAAFDTSGERTPRLEISPETALDEDRQAVRDPALFFSNEQLYETLDTVREIFGSSLRVEVYYSRYHRAQDSPAKLERELAGIHHLHRRVRQRGFGNVVVTNYHLATDVGSRNWDLLMGQKGGDGLDTLLRGLEGMGRSGLDNLCLYVPDSLTRETVEAHDRLVSWLDLLHKQRPDCYFTATTVLDFDGLTGCLRAVIEERRRAGWGDEVTLAGLSCLLRELAREVEEKEHGVAPLRRTLVRDLALLHAGHLAALGRTVPGDQGPLAHRPLLDEEKLCLTDWDLAAAGFAERVEHLGDLPPVQPTLTLYCGRRMVGFPRSYECWFRLFDGSRTVDQVLNEVGGDGSLDGEELRRLLFFITRHHRQFTC